MVQEIFHFLGRAICHQLDDRSLHVSGKTLSVCARDTGIYIGIFSSLFYLHFFKRKTPITIPSIKTSLYLLLLLIPLMVDGLGSYLHLFESSNARRLWTGISFGLALPYFVYPLLSGKSLEESSERVINKGKDLYWPIIISSILGVVFYWGVLPYYVLDGLIIFTVLVWFSLLASFLFSKISSKHLKWGLSIILGLSFLSTLSLMHEWLLN
ncbi:DUF2085 domain-containing protein [Neobacillus niacini]|uniref:DUF2085 domain-containing protein n=1 Tax=Neobacillus niacini TaxID=86668 RepID=UPI002856EF9C|nr:DUF2085 domain-containing protein [Neobacillus niacini]MDR6999513.1 putative membrane protein [Neobacillus niacini]